MSIDFYWPIAVVILGACVGSFLNVLIYRLPDDLPVTRPRSACRSCQRPISWYDNIPIISYFLLQGRCRNCKAKIAIQYPLVECAAAVGFLAIYMINGYHQLSFSEVLQVQLSDWVAMIREWMLVCIGISVSVIDIRHRIIPNEISLGGWAVALLTSPWDRYLPVSELFLTSFGIFFIFLLFGVVYEKMTGRMGMGGGDIKLMAALGAFIGFGGMWATLIISSVCGVFVGLIVSRFQKDENEGILKTSIPYGPFLILGALSEYFLRISEWLNLNPFR